MADEDRNRGSYFCQYIKDGYHYAGWEHLLTAQETALLEGSARDGLYHHMLHELAYSRLSWLMTDLFPLLQTIEDLTPELLREMFHKALDTSNIRVVWNLEAHDPYEWKFFLLPKQSPATHIEKYILRELEECRKEGNRF